MSLYRLGGVPQGWPIHPDDLIEDGWLVPVTETLLTREEAANDEHVQRMVWAQLTGGALPTGGDRR